MFRYYRTFAITKDYKTINSIKRYNGKNMEMVWQE